jgi:hypothetical protein
MHAYEARVPVLVGPIPCIGCAPAPPPPGPPQIKDESRASFFGASSSGMNSPRISYVEVRDAQPTITSQTHAAFPDPCRADVRVTKIDASALGFDFGFVYAEVVVALQAVVSSQVCPWTQVVQQIR